MEEKAELASSDVIVMEILAGARDDADRDRLRRLLYGQRFLAVEGPADYESAAELLCEDADFEVIARHAPLRLAIR